MRLPHFVLASIICLLVVAPASSLEVDPTYQSVRASQPDGRTIALNDFAFERDVFRFRLTGTLHLLAPVGGKTFGAVFLGQGSWELTPATAAEKRQLQHHAGDDKLATIVDQFDSAVFLGTALVAAAEKGGAIVAGTPDPKAADRWRGYMKQQGKTLHTNMQIRLLQELVDGDGPWFFAWIDGKKLPPSVLIVDPQGSESVRLAGRDLGGEQTMMYVSHDSKGGIWYSSHLRSEIESGKKTLEVDRADAAHYVIDSTIRGSQLTGATTMTFTVATPMRVLPVDLAPKLAIRSVQFAPAGDSPQWTAVPVIREEDDPDAAVVFAAPLQPGTKYLLRIEYDGKEVLDNAGDGNFTVTRRSSWYPNLGVFDDLATFELHFKTPQKFQIVAIGRESENRVEGDERIATWIEDRPVRVAGFNYGKFKKLEQTDKDSGMTFEVYTNPGTPDILVEINQALEYLSTTEGGPSYVKVDTASLAKAAMADGINTARAGSALYGPLDTKRVAITQQSQWFFGQSWPSLVYMPYVAFLNGTVRHWLGLDEARDFVENVGPHELAHQWWGHQVGFRSYRDEWISEGFSEFTAAVVAQQTGGWARYNDFFEKARRSILEKPRGAVVTNAEAGPISQGWRVGSWRNPSAYGVVVYSKGAYVLHMLRMAMFDPKRGDDAFIAMMREFASTYSGRSATTADFQRVVEKHATPNLRLTKDGKLDWFFRQWIDGTAIPRLASKLDFTESGGGKYKVSGSITQSEVPDDFGSVVTLYVQLDKNTMARLGTTAILGNATKPIEFELALPKKPMKFVINANHDVLSR